MPSKVDEFLAASLRRQRLVRWGSGLSVAMVLVTVAWVNIGNELIQRVQWARVQWHGIRVHPKHNLPYVYIPSGSFSLVCSDHPGRCGPDELRRPVRIAKSFWIGQTEVTQKAFLEVMKQEAPVDFPGDNKPMHTVDWLEAKKFCEHANLRLPTEDEWEHAARAGGLLEQYGQLDQIAVYDGNSPSEVRTKLPNRWGLYVRV